MKVMKKKTVSVHICVCVNADHLEEFKTSIALRKNDYKRRDVTHNALMSSK